MPVVVVIIMGEATRSNGSGSANVPSTSRAMLPSSRRVTVSPVFPLQWAGNKAVTAAPVCESQLNWLIRSARSVWTEPSSSTMV